MTRDAAYALGCLVTGGGDTLPTDIQEIEGPLPDHVEKIADNHRGVAQRNMPPEDLFTCVVFCQTVLEEYPYFSE